MLRQRTHLAHLAAEQPVVDRAIEEVRAVAADHLRDLVPVRREQLQVESGIAVAQLLDQLVRLARQASRVDTEHLDRWIERVRHVDQRDAVDLEGGRDRDARRELAECPLEHRLRLVALALDGELAGFPLVELERSHAVTSSSLTRCFAGSSPASAPSSSSSSLRANAGKLSPSLRPPSQPALSPSPAPSNSSVGARRNRDRPIAALRPRLPPAQTR